MIWLLALAAFWTIAMVWLVHAALASPEYPAYKSFLDHADTPHGQQ